MSWIVICRSGAEGILNDSYYGPYNNRAVAENEDTTCEYHHDIHELIGPGYGSTRRMTTNPSNEELEQEFDRYGRDYRCRQPGANNGPGPTDSRTGNYSCERGPRHPGDHAWYYNDNQVIRWPQGE